MDLGGGLDELPPPVPPLPPPPPPLPPPAVLSSSSSPQRARPSGSSWPEQRVPVTDPPVLPVGGASSTLERVVGSSAAVRKLVGQSRALKLYVYRPKPRTSGWCATNLTSRFPGCKRFQWSGDWELIRRMRRSAQHTKDGDAADFYVVPFLSKCYYNHAASYELAAMDVALRQVLTFLSKSPWWKSRPERHLFFFMSGVGAGLVPSWRPLISRAIFIVAEGDREADYFREGHDIIVPGKISVPPAPVEEQSSPWERPLMAVFRGSLDATLRDAEGERVRQRNKLRRWLDVSLRDDRSYIFSGRKSKRYVEEMDEARYCIIPRGNTPWTRRFFAGPHMVHCRTVHLALGALLIPSTMCGYRFFDATVRGCIPAVLSDPVAFPFERLLDFSRMTLKLPEQWVPKLKRELSSVNTTAAAALQEQLQRSWPAFVYGKGGGAGGGVAFEMLLLELAARKHGFYRTWTPATPNSVHSFWSPARGAFTLAGARKVGPSWGAGATPH